MSSFELVSSETLPLTAAMAKEFMEMPGSPTERDLSKKRVDLLQEKAEANLLTPFGWAVAIIDGKKYRMNGQHSSNMLAGLNGSFPDGLKVHLDTYNIENTRGLALLFRQFDYRQGSRGPHDVAGAYQGLESDLKDVNKKSAKLAVEGINWQQKIIEGIPSPKGDDQYALFNEARFHSFIIWAAEILSIKTPEMQRIQVLSAMYSTFDRNEDEAQKFWDEVSRGGVEYADHHPTSVLSEWLMTAKKGEHKVRPKPAEFYNACLYAWNSWRNDKDLDDKERELKKIKISNLKSNIDPSS